MRSRAGLMHLDFIIGGWNILRYHSCYLLEEMEDSRRIRLSRGCLPSFLMFRGSPSIFLSFSFCYLYNFIFISTHCLWSAVCLCKIHVWHTCRDWSEDWSSRRCFNFNSALLGWFPTLPPITLLRKFLLPLPCLVVAPEKSELSQSSPRLAPRTEST